MINLCIHNSNSVLPLSKNSEALLQQKLLKTTVVFAQPARMLSISQLFNNEPGLPRVSCIKDRGTGTTHNAIHFI